MNRNSQQYETTLYKESNLEQIIQEALVKEIGGYFDSLIGAKIITRSHVKRDFHMDYSTIQKLREGNPSVSKDTLEKVAYLIAYYLVEQCREVEAEENGMEKRLKMKALGELEKQFERIYGSLAHILLKKANGGVDLRQIVKNK